MVPDLAAKNSSRIIGGRIMLGILMILPLMILPDSLTLSLPASSGLNTTSNCEENMCAPKGEEEPPFLRRSLSDWGALIFVCLL